MPFRDFGAGGAAGSSSGEMPRQKREPMPASKEKVPEKVEFTI